MTRTWNHIGSNGSTHRIEFRNGGWCIWSDAMPERCAVRPAEAMEWFAWFPRMARYAARRLIIDTMRHAARRAATTA